MDSIRISRKHGINPCLSQCFWCGKTKNKIALLEALKDDAEAPRIAVFNYEPCDECKTQMSYGVCVMESADGRTPTGAFVVITEDAVRRLFTPQSVVDAVMRHKKAYMEPDVFRKLFPRPA